MIGGYFDGHPWGVFDAPLVVEDAGFPGMEHLPRRFTLKDEIYQIKDFSRDNVRVLLSLDAGKIDLAERGSSARTTISRSSGPASTARDASSTTAWGTSRKSGTGPISRRCGWRWCNGRWGSSPAMRRRETKGRSSFFLISRFLDYVRTRRSRIDRSNLTSSIAGEFWKE